MDSDKENIANSNIPFLQQRSSLKSEPQNSKEKEERTTTTTLGSTNLPKKEVKKVEVESDGTDEFKWSDGDGNTTDDFELSEQVEEDSDIETKDREKKKISTQIDLTLSDSEETEVSNRDE